LLPLGTQDDVRHVVTTITMSSSRTSRRQFLASGAAAAASLGFPAITRSRSPNAKLNLVFIGVGGRGGGNLSSISGIPMALPKKKDGADPKAPPPALPSAADAAENIVALCDVNAQNLELAAKFHPGAQTFRDFRKLYDTLKPSEIDGVVVSTTEHTHAYATLPALLMKKPVYCEKPLSHNVAEARLITQAAAEAGVATQMGTQIHSSANYRRVVELIQSGAIGKVTEAHVCVSRAWGLQTKEEAEKNKDIIFVDERPERGPGAAAAPRLGPVDRPRANAALQRRLFPRPQMVSLVGFRQWHHERPRQPLERPALLGAQTRRPAQHRGLWPQSPSRDRPGQHACGV
jgi:hypothetical protein